MYTKDLNHRLTLRLDDDSFDFVCTTAEQLGLTPSSFIRLTIASLKTTMVNMVDFTKGEVDSHVDEQPNKHNKL